MTGMTGSRTGRGFGRRSKYRRGGDRSSARMAHALPGLRRTSPLERGQLTLLALLALLTAAAWGQTVHQARTMEMPMGVVARGGADVEPGEPAAAANGMVGMDDAAMGEPAANEMGEVGASGMAGM